MQRKHPHCPKDFDTDSWSQENLSQEEVGKRDLIDQKSWWGKTSTSTYQPKSPSRSALLSHDVLFLYREVLGVVLSGHVQKCMCPPCCIDQCERRHNKAGWQSSLLLATPCWSGQSYNHLPWHSAWNSNTCTSWWISRLFASLMTWIQFKVTSSHFLWNLRLAHLHVLLWTNIAGTVRMKQIMQNGHSLSHWSSLRLTTSTHAFHVSVSSSPISVEDVV